jgi:hypothetical protein
MLALVKPDGRQSWHPHPDGGCRGCQSYHKLTRPPAGFSRAFAVQGRGAANCAGVDAQTRGWLSRRQSSRFPFGKRRADFAAASRFPRLIAGFDGARIHIRFIAPLKPPFKSPLDHRDARERQAVRAGGALRGKRSRTGESDMARYEIAGLEGGALGQASAAADTFFDLGMMYSTGRSVPTDLVTAHKWFNIAALRGNRDAIRLRVEIAAEMSEAEIAAAQRAARDWLSAH